MEENPYSAPLTSNAAESQTEKNCESSAAIGGALKGAVAGMMTLLIPVALGAFVTVVLTAIAEIRADGGFSSTFHRLKAGRSLEEIVEGFAGALASFAFWGAVVGSVVSRSRARSG